VITMLEQITKSPQAGFLIRITWDLTQAEVQRELDGLTVAYNNGKAAVERKKSIAAALG